MKQPFHVIIPARFDSVRLPGKPLLIERVAARHRERREGGSEAFFWGGSEVMAQLRCAQRLGRQPARAEPSLQQVRAQIVLEAAGVLLGAKDVDQGAGVHHVDMLGEQLDAGVGQRFGDALVHGAQTLDRREQAEPAAAPSQRGTRRAVTRATTPHWSRCGSSSSPAAAARR